MQCAPSLLWKKKWTKKWEAQTPPACLVARHILRVMELTTDQHNWGNTSVGPPWVKRRRSSSPPSNEEVTVAEVLIPFLDRVTGKPELFGCVKPGQGNFKTLQVEDKLRQPLSRSRTPFKTFISFMCVWEWCGVGRPISLTEIISRHTPISPSLTRVVVGEYEGWLTAPFFRSPS